jgi:uncharacterized BrkB/YihY/UPF0761 family membrane protein
MATTPAGVPAGEDGAPAASAAAQRDRQRKLIQRIKAAQEQSQARWERIEASRPNNRTVDTVLSTYERDRVQGGSLLAGALAYRVFFWVLPFALLLVATMGFLSQGSRSPKNWAASLGVLGFASSSVTQADAVATRAKWTLLVISVAGIYGTSVSLVKALRTSHALIWRVPLSPFHHRLKAVLFMNAAIFVIIGLLALEQGARKATPVGGLAVTLAFLVAVAAIWLVVTGFLPHGGTTWRDLVPGAVVVAVGGQTVHLLTVYYVAHKLMRASATYGQLGAAAAVLLSLFFLARVIVAGAALNAHLCDTKPSRPPPSPGKGQEALAAATRRLAQVRRDA